jgi:hypothetical protein
MNAAELRAIDGLTLSAERRALLRPGEIVTDASGISHHLPRFFYEIESWSTAREIQLAPHFKLSELMTVDCREADLLLRVFPHYVSCAIVILARFLEDLRREVDAPVFVSANGGYRSPGHRANAGDDSHCWGTAADIYRIGNTFLDDEKSIAKYGEIARALGPEVLVRPFGHGAGETDDHLHLDLGFLTLIPRECGE